MNKTILIIGRSEFVTPKRLKSLMKLPFDKLSINHTVEGVDFVAFIDKHIIETPAKVITIKQNGGDFSLIKYRGALVSGEFKDQLSYFGFTHDMVLSWCVKQGYQNAILIGAADFIGSGHYNIKQDFNPSPRAIKESIHAIENIYSKELKIYTMNKNSKLQIGRITLEELKKL